MPIYEFECTCGLVYEALMRWTESSELELKCPDCGGHTKTMLYSAFATNNVAIHESERPVVYRNPRTGDIRYPPSADMPMNQKYADQGYVREFAFSTPQERKEFEAKTGKVHERSHYDPGSNTAEQDCDPIHGQRAAEAKFKREVRRLGGL